MKKKMRSYGLGLLVASWALLVGGGMKLLADYQNVPGQSANTQAEWPLQSSFPYSKSTPTLVMLAHPQCPCTRSSLTELARIMAQCKGELIARVLFLKPEAMEENWLHSDLWEKAAAIPGVKVERDENGQMAERFGAKTSGQVLLYDTYGKLVFSGGITDSRGHEGDNAGSDAIVAFVRNGRATTENTPVFGCAVFTPPVKAASLQ